MKIRPWVGQRNWAASQQKHGGFRGATEARVAVFLFAEEALEAIWLVDLAERGLNGNGRQAARVFEEGLEEGLDGDSHVRLAEGNQVFTEPWTLDKALEILAA